MVLLTPSTRPLAPLTTSGPAARPARPGRIPAMLWPRCDAVWWRDELDARDAESAGDVPGVVVVVVVAVAFAEESADSGVWLCGRGGDCAGDGDAVDDGDAAEDEEDTDEDDDDDDDEPELTDSRNEQLLWLGLPSAVAGCGWGCSCGCLGSSLLIGEAVVEEV